MILLVIIIILQNKYLFKSLCLFVLGRRNLGQRYNGVTQLHSSLQHRSNPYIPIPSDTTCTICGRSFQTNRNLKNHFTHKHKKQKPSLTHPGFWPCRADIRCKCCKTDGKFTGTVKSSTTGETITLQHTTSNTSDVIYLIECINRN